MILGFAFSEDEDEDDSEGTNSDLPMTLPPGLYSGTSSLALVNSLSTRYCSAPIHKRVCVTLSIFDDQVARASAFGMGLVYGNMKLKVLKVKLIETFEDFVISF